jgi:hypothetical protein
MRKLLWLAVLAAGIGSGIGFTSGAQHGPRALSFTGNYSTVVSHNLPQIGTLNNVEALGGPPQADEPLHSCHAGGAHTGKFSIWIAVAHPGGKLIIDTAGSNYDTVISAYRYSGVPPLGLRPAACNDKAGLPARLNAALPGGSYFIQISQHEDDPLASGLTLNVSARYNSGGLEPANDEIGGAKALIVNKAVKTKNAEFSTPGTDNTVYTGCNTSQGVWYTFIAPVSGVYSFSTAGSVLHQSLANAGSSLGTGIGLYEQGIAASIACDSGSVQPVSDAYAVIESATLTGGTRYYVKVGNAAITHSTGPSVFRLMVRLLSTASAFNSGISFETASDLAQWKTKNFSAGDGRSTDTALNGTYSLKITHSPTVAKKLMQIVTLPSGFQPKADDTFLWSIDVLKSTPLAEARYVFVVRYTDGRPASKIKGDLLGTTNFFTNLAALTLASGKVNKIKLTITVKPSPTAGSLYFDMIRLLYYTDPVRGGGGLLPVPVSPAAG